MISITTQTGYKLHLCDTHMHIYVYTYAYTHQVFVTWLTLSHLLGQFFTPKPNSKCCLPQDTIHSMPSSIMERSIVLVRFSIRSIWVKSFFQLRVALIDLAGQVFISIYKSFAELGGCISHVAILAINGTSFFPLHALVARFCNMLHSLKKTNSIPVIL